MEHSKHYNTVLRAYRMGMWKINHVRDAVEKEWISKAEFKTITGEDYE